MWDAVSIIVGIVIGAGIFETAPLILRNVSGPWAALGVWLLGGAMSLVGALCYAELATTYPQWGGDYVYLTRAYGRFTGFMFGWAQLTVVLTASIGAMAFVFADYAVRLWGLSDVAVLGELAWPATLALAAVAALSAINLAGAVIGSRAQNVLSILKVLGLAGIVVAGFGWGNAAGWRPPAVAEPGSVALAMILVLYTYGGWNDCAFVAAEVRDPRRNISRALVVGIGCITLIYLLVNSAYIWGLGFARAGQSSAIAADVLALSLGPWGGKAMAILVIVSALGACNGLIFAGARIYSRMGSDHAALAWLGGWHPRLGVPVWSLVVQAAVSMAMIVLVGSLWGQRWLNAALASLRLAPADWSGRGGFETLVACSAPVFWSFFLLTGISLFVLRVKDRGVERPFKVPLYPWIPLAFCAICIWMLVASLRYIFAVNLQGGLLVAVSPLAVGAVVYVLTSRRAPGQSADREGPR
jgi:amino acid transporter